MKIKSFNNKSSVSQTGPAGGAGSANKAGKAESNQSKSVTTGNAPAVSVSGTDRIASAMSADAATRSDKVARVKFMVESGEYQDDPKQTADSILRNLTDYSLA